MVKGDWPSFTKKQVGVVSFFFLFTTTMQCTLGLVSLKKIISVGNFSKTGI